MNVRMKIMFSMLARLLPAGAFLCLWMTIASAQSTTNYDYTFPVNKAVPDGDLNGLALPVNLTDMGGTITNVTVSLDISGGYNGDLYVYLRGPDGGFAVLLNRVGVTSGNAFGYPDTGFDVVFDDSTGNNNIHFYQNFNPQLNGVGQLTGTWSSDGRDIDPRSAPALFDTTLPTALLTSFNGTNPNGTWTLFLADVSSGAQSTVVSWNLNIETVPEPSSCALLGIGIILAARKWINRSR
jgi:subtilisin-like proprotein convertase family protein